jgi:hypothetical protein
VILKNSVFLSGPFWIFFPHENRLKFLGYQGCVEILMITLVSSQKSLPQNISAGSVPCLTIPYQNAKKI